MRYNTMTSAFIIAALAAALMLSSVVVFIPQADARLRVLHSCNPNSPEGKTGGTDGPPCGPGKRIR